MSTPNNQQFDFESFNGFSPPYYTPVPDLLFDHIMQDLNAGELKTVLYIVRRTFGFKRSSDEISLSQMLHGITTKDGRQLDRGTGLSKKTLLKSLRSLKDKNLIKVQRNQSEVKGDMATTYQLKTASSPEEKSTPPRGGESTPGGWGRNSPTQETVIQETVHAHEKVFSISNNNSSGDPDEKNDVVVLLTDKGISEKVAKRLASRYKRSRIEEKIEHLEFLLETDPDRVAKPQGWLRTAIEDNYKAPDGYKSREAREAEEQEAERHRQAIMDQKLTQHEEEKQMQVEQQKAHEKTLKKLKEEYHTSGETETLETSWQSHFEATGKEAAPPLHTGWGLLSASDNKVVVWVINVHVKQQITQQYDRTIRQLAAKHFGIPLKSVTLTMVTTAESPP